MALIDLAKYDITDLTLSAHYSDDAKGEFLSDYLAAFAGYLSESVEGQLTDADGETMKNLLTSDDVTPEKIEQFYRDRIPNFDAYLLGAVLQFKKGFILEFYRSMMARTTKVKDPSAALWIKAAAAADEDRWDEVSRLVEQIKRDFMKQQSSQPKLELSSPAAS